MCFQPLSRGFFFSFSLVKFLFSKTILSKILIISDYFKHVCKWTLIFVYNLSFGLLSFCKSGPWAKQIERPCSALWAASQLFTLFTAPFKEADIYMRNFSGCHLEDICVRLCNSLNSDCSFECLTKMWFTHLCELVSLPLRKCWTVTSFVTESLCYST